MQLIFKKLILIISILHYGINIMIHVLFATVILYSSIFAIPLIFIIYISNFITRIDKLLTNTEEKHELRRSERLMEKKMKKSSSENIIH